MRFGIIGAGGIGATIARKLVDAGHAVKLANSRAPEMLSALAKEIGATPVNLVQVIEDVDAVVLSIPFFQIPLLAPLFANLPPGVAIIETCNYYPARDARIAEVEKGKPESIWVGEQIGRPIARDAAYKAYLETGSTA